MPSLNLKTKTIRYSKADQMMVSGCCGLLNTMMEYDPEAKRLAGEVFPKLDGLYQHIERLRNGRRTPPKPADGKGA